MADHLPDDLLADVLARLAPRWLAASRGVCRSWRAVVDARRLLRADLLPLSLAGILLEVDAWTQVLFSRPSMGPAATCAGLVAFLGADGTRRIDTYMLGHCNGLLLLQGLVINPATGQWARLPRPPPPPLPADYDISLAFDPAVSPCYEVFSVPEDPYSLLKLSGRQPSPLVLPVFSSRTGQWEERTFVPEGHGHPMEDPSYDHHDHPMEDPSYDHHGHDYSTFCRGRLYVHCKKGFVMRYPQFYLGKSKAGVCFASVEPHACRLQVWRLNDESSAYGQPEWVLRCDENLRPLLAPRRSYRDRGDGPWLLRYLGEDEDDKEGQLEWSSDIEDVGEPEDGSGGCNGDDDERIEFLGFHPFKEIVFLNQSDQRGIAYHLDRSKIQDIGSVDLRRTFEYIEVPFPYTPCWMTGVFPGNN